MSFDATLTIARIYEAAIMPDSWLAALDDLTDLSSAFGMVMFSISPQAPRWIATDSMRPIMETFLAEGWADRNSRPGRMMALNHEGFIHDLEAYESEEEIANDPLYRDFLYPRGLGWGAGAFITPPTDDTVVFTIERRFDRGPFERSVLDQLDGLRPHLARAALISSRLAQERLRNATELMEALKLPAGALSLGGKLLSANALLQENASILWRARDRVAFADASAAQHLDQALERFARGDDGGLLSFPIRATATRPGQIAHLLPIKGSARDIFARTHALLVLTPLTAPGAPPIALLKGLFDLTPAEAKVARGIVAGRTTEELAQDASVSRETIRSQLKSVLGKTGVGRQSDLVRLLSGVMIGRA